MPRPHRHANGRTQLRSGSGAFRPTTMADVGLGCCDKCGGIFAPDYSGMGDGLIDPAEFRRRQRTCGECLGLAGAERPGMFVREDAK